MIKFFKADVLQDHLLQNKISLVDERVVQWAEAPSGNRTKGRHKVKPLAQILIWLDAWIQQKL